MPRRKQFSPEQTTPKSPPIDPVAWRIDPWLKAVPITRSCCYNWIAEGKIETAKIGGVRFIVISPKDFIDRHRESEPEL